MVGHAYLVPFNNRKTGKKEAQFIIGYRGMIDLARRSGTLESIKAEPVYENDFFKLSYGLEDRLEHVPYHCREDGRQSESGAFRGSYAVAKFKEGGHAILYMPKAEIDQHRKRSKSSDSGPWVTDYVQMALKTAVRGLWKWLPISVEVARQVEGTDETAKTAINSDMSEAIDIGEAQDMFADAETAIPEPTRLDPFAKIQPKYVARARGALNIQTAFEKLTAIEVENIKIKAQEIEEADF
jgi:recombination protein RecT